MPVESAAFQSANRIIVLPNRFVTEIKSRPNNLAVHSTITKYAGTAYIKAMGYECKTRIFQIFGNGKEIPIAP